MRVALHEIRMFWHYIFISLIGIIVDENFIVKKTSEYSMEVPPFFIAIMWSICSYLIIVIQLYRKEPVNRLVLALSLFLSVGLIAQLNSMLSVLYYYDNYASLLAFAFIIVVGLFTMLFTQASFIGVLSDDKRAVRIASLKLLGVTILAAMLSFYVDLFTFWIFFLVLYDWRLRYILKGGSSRSWKFKWKY